MSSHDETRLPKWAQIELARLRANLASAEKKLHAMEADESEVGIRTYEYLENKTARTVIPLPPGSTIVFRPDNGGEIEVGVRDGRVNVRAAGAPHRLIFQPESSNTGRLFNVRVD